MNATLTTTTFDITTLARRSNPENPMQRQVQCNGNCGGWFNLYWNNNAQCFLPINCHRCNIDIVPEPATPVVAAPQVVEPVIVAENATEAEPGPVAEPVALRPVRPEQKAYFVKFILNSDQTKTYAMLFRKSDGLAVGCECKSRKFHHGVACKHMRNHNAMLAKPAVAA